MGVWYGVATWQIPGVVLEGAMRQRKCFPWFRATLAREHKGPTFGTGPLSASQAHRKLPASPHFSTTPSTSHNHVHPFLCINPHLHRPGLVFDHARESG